MKRFVFLMAATAFCLPATAFAQQPPISRTNQPSAATRPSGPVVIPSGKVAVIDSSSFPATIDEYKKQIKILEAEFGQRQKDLEALTTRYQKLAEELNGPNASMLGQEVLRKKADEAAALEKEIKRKSEDLQADVDKRKQAVLGPLSEKVFRFLENYAQGRNIVVIFDLAATAQNPFIIHVAAGTNVTDDFVKEYNKANPVAATPPSPAPNK